MSTDDELERAEAVDFARTPLSYERFRQLARNPNLGPEEKIGFPSSYRRGFEDFILDDITRKLDPLRGEGKTVVDIGCGVGGVTTRVIELAQQRAHRLVLVDSEEMLAQLDAGDGVRKVAGMYPANAQAVRDAAGGGADAVLCYSVLHYVFVDTNLFRFLDCLMDLLAPGGMALIGDIPNVSKRRRFFSSENGIAFHKAFTQTTEPPAVRHFAVEHDLIDDAVLAGLVARAQAAGCHAYVVPQDSRLPMANRRDDLLIQKP